MGEGPIQGNGLKKDPQITKGKNLIKEFFSAENSIMKNLPKSKLPEGDPGALDPEAAKYAAKKQTKISKKSVVSRRKDDTAASPADPDFENVDLKMLKRK